MLQGQSPKQNNESSVGSCAADVNTRNLPNTVVADLEVSVVNFTSALRVDCAMRKLAFPLTLLMAGAIQGCAAGPQFFGHTDKTSCHEPGSDEWWAEKALLRRNFRTRITVNTIGPCRTSVRIAQRFVT